MQSLRHWMRRQMEAFRRQWNEDMSRTRQASDAAEMEFRRELNEALIKIRENERQNVATRRQLARLSEMVAKQGARLGKHSQKILELDQRQGIVDALLEGGGSSFL